MQKSRRRIEWMRVGEKGVAKAKPETRIKRRVEAYQQIRREEL